MKIIKRIFTSITNIGIHENLDQREVKRTKILNFAAFFMGVNIFIGLLVKSFTDGFSLVINGIFFVEAIVYFSVLIFHAFQKFIVARFYFLICFTIILFYHNNFLYTGEYTEYYYLVVPIGSLLFFDSKYVHYTFLVVALLLFYIPNFFLNLYNKESFGFYHVIPFFVGVFIAVQYFRNENLKNEKKLETAYKKLEDAKAFEVAHLQLKSLKAQMNPHFMFNAMNSIQSLVLKGDKHEAYNYLTKFSSLIRENLNMSEKSFTSFDEELSLLKKYLELEELRFQDNFEYEITEEDEILDIKIPSMVIQPFIENAIKHGLLHKTEGVKKVKIKFYLNDVFKCIIEDNGIGLKASEAINKANYNKEVSFSTKAIKDRLLLLKNYYGADIGVVYEDIPVGTKVIIKIPFTTF